MTDIYLIRHAEAEGNAYRRIQGQYNSDITLLGQKQIEAVAKRFEDVDIAGVISSDLLRAKKTARAIAQKHGLDVIERANFREINMGSWENMPWGNLNRQYPKEMKVFLHDIEHFSIPGSENIAEVKKRMKYEMIKVAEEYKGKRIVVVSHGTAINALLADLLGMTCMEMKKSKGFADNTSVNLLKCTESGIEVIYCNDACHLSASISTYERQRKWREYSNQMDGTYFSELKKEDLEKFDSYDKEKVNRLAKICINKFKIMIENHCIGMIFLGDEDNDIGIIEYCWIAPNYRKQRIGIQLIGQAVSVFRNCGKKFMKVTLEGKEYKVLDFFINAGFLITDVYPQQIVLKRNIEYIDI